MAWTKHFYRVGPYVEKLEDAPSDPADLKRHRQRVEPWLSALFQSEHLSLLVGSGLTTAIAAIAEVRAADMSIVKLGTKYDDAIDAEAKASAAKMKRGSANFEDQLRSALAVFDGLRIIEPRASTELHSALDTHLLKFLEAVLETERSIAAGKNQRSRDDAAAALQSFLLSFASRAASRERLHVFSTNYDRLVEFGCDLAGLRIIDRFVGALTPAFRSSRVEVDVHYNPPGIRGEPRFLEGVLRLTKLHGSLDWHFDPIQRLIRKVSIPFGAAANHTDIPRKPIDTVMIYPNAAKDFETTAFPYADLFRDFAAAICRPNSVIVTYGYGYGDDHINRVLRDMLTIPSTHLVIISYAPDDRITAFCDGVGKDAQISLMAGPHFADLATLTDLYLPKPALDFVSARVTDLLKNRPAAQRPEEEAKDGEATRNG